MNPNPFNTHSNPQNPKNSAGLPTPRCNQEMEAALGDFAEGSLAPQKHAAVAQHLETCAACAKQVRELQALAAFFHALPPRAPVLDIWAELAPKVASWEAEEKLGAAERMRVRSHRFLHNVAAGAILFTQVLAMNTEARMHKYLMGGSLRFADGTSGAGASGTGREAR